MKTVIFFLVFFSASYAQYRKDICGSSLDTPYGYVTSEYDRQGEYMMQNYDGFYAQFIAASPYYYALYPETFTSTEVVGFKISPGSNYLSRNQIPTSTDYRRINPTAFTPATLLRTDFATRLIAGGPLLSSTNWGDGQVRYISAQVQTTTVGGRIANSWVKNSSISQGEWQLENACEFFSGSYFEVRCNPLWAYSNGQVTLNMNDFDHGFGSGNPLTDADNTPASLSTSYQLQSEDDIEINLYYNLGTNDSLTITGSPAAAAFVVKGPAVGYATLPLPASSGTGGFTANYRTVSEDGYGFRAVYNSAQNGNACYKTGGSDQCADYCTRTYVCSGVPTMASLMSDFDYSSCCDSAWGPQCVLAADAVKWLQVCGDDSELNNPYPPQAKRDLRQELMLTYETLPGMNLRSSQLQRTIMSFETVTSAGTLKGRFV